MTIHTFSSYTALLSVLSLTNYRQEGYYHVKNLSTQSISSFLELSELIHFFLKCDAADEYFPHIIRRQLITLDQRLSEDVIIRAPLHFSKTYVIWKGRYQTGLLVTEETLDSPQKLPSRDRIFLVDLKFRTIKTFKTLSEISRRLGISATQIGIARSKGKPFSAGRYFVMTDETSASACLNRYPHPIKRCYRHIQSITVYDLTSSVTQDFTSIIEMAKHYNINHKRVVTLIATLASDCHHTTKIPGCDNLTFRVTFKDPHLFHKTLDKETSAP